jgi:hypothetical protein
MTAIVAVMHGSHHRSHARELSGRHALGTQGVEGWPTGLLSMLFPKGDPTTIVSAAEPTTAESACPESGQSAPKPSVLQQGRPGGECTTLGDCTRGAHVPKLKYWNAAKWTFAHQGINKLRTAERIGFGTQARCVQKCARGEKSRLLHTKKVFSKRQNIVR